MSKYVEALRQIAEGTMPCRECDVIHEMKVVERKGDGSILRVDWAADDGHPYRQYLPGEYAKKVLLYD